MDWGELRDRVAAGEHFVYLLFFRHRTSIPGGTDEACLSQWYPSPFQIDGVQYPTAEHFMMAEKARCFSDESSLAKILGDPDPKRAKAFGRKVGGYEDDHWQEKRLDAVIRGNCAKFVQNPSLGQFLKNTGKHVLVEASPRDRVWGIGLGKKDPKARNPLAWKGQNLLGFALMEVRRRLVVG